MSAKLNLLENCNRHRDSYPWKYLPGGNSEIAALWNEESTVVYGDRGVDSQSIDHRFISVRLNYLGTIYIPNFLFLVSHSLIDSPLNLLPHSIDSSSAAILILIVSSSYHSDFWFLSSFTSHCEWLSSISFQLIYDFSTMKEMTGWLLIFDFSSTDLGWVRFFIICFLFLSKDVATYH